MFVTFLHVIRANDSSWIPFIGCRKNATQMFINTTRAVCLVSMRFNIHFISFSFSPFYQWKVQAFPKRESFFAQHYCRSPDRMLVSEKGSWMSIFRFSYHYLACEQCIHSKSHMKQNEKKKNKTEETYTQFVLFHAVCCDIKTHYSRRTQSKRHNRKYAYIYFHVIYLLLFSFLLHTFRSHFPLCQLFICMNGAQQPLTVLTHLCVCVCVFAIIVVMFLLSVKRVDIWMCVSFYFIVLKLM